MAVHWPQVFNMIPSLEALLVSCSSLQAQPSRRTQLNFTKLVVLHVSRNDDFVNPIGTSTIPEFLASMKNTRYLDLFGTSILSGEVHIGNLANLQYLSLSSIPNIFSTDLSWLTHLYNSTLTHRGREYITHYAYY